MRYVKPISLLLLFMVLTTLTAMAIHSHVAALHPIASVSSAMDVRFRLELRAKLCRALLLNLLTVANLSIEEREGIEKLLSVNISKLTETELKNYVEMVCGYLSELRHRLELHKLIGAEVVIRNLSHRLEKIIERKLKLLNITNVSRALLLRIRYAHNLTELHRILAELRRIYMPRALGVFGNVALSFINKVVVRIANTGSKRALHIAMVNVDRAIQVLNTTLRSLELVNASPKAIEAVKEAITKLYTVKELLAYVRSEIENVTIAKPGLRLRLRIALRTCMGMMIEDLNISISTVVRELEKLIDIAREKGESELVKELSTVLEELKQIQQILAKGANLSIGQRLALIIRAKALLHRAKTVLLRASIELGIVKKLQTDVDSLVEEVKSLLDEVRRLKHVAKELQIRVVEKGRLRLVPLVRKLLTELALAEKLAKRIVIEVKKGDVVWAWIQLSTTKRLVLEASELIEKLLELLREEKPVTVTTPTPSALPKSKPTPTSPAVKGPKGPRGRP